MKFSEFWLYLAGMTAAITSDIKGALFGGLASMILDNGTLLHRIINGSGSILVSMAFTRGFLDIFGNSLPKTDNVVMFFSAFFAIIGLVLVEILQRAARRLLGRTDAVVDGAVKKYSGVDLPPAPTAEDRKNENNR